VFEARWCVLVPQKALSRAKGRLELDPPARRAVAEAMLRDTVAAILASGGVGRVVVLWDDERDAGTLTAVEGLATSGRGLNEALVQAANRVRGDDPGADLAVVPGDLPALRPADLARCLDLALGHGGAFLPDAAGVGTTVLTATGGTPLAPAYGGCSTLAHAASGAHLIDPTDLDSARADVDDVASLHRALALGCGRHTRAACAALGLVAPGQRLVLMSEL
jgi:2-phospho-L-lactate/phosphoenolpyruvate guanylyltransferase